MDVVGKITKAILDELRGKLNGAVWKEIISDDRHYKTYFTSITQFGEISQAFFLCLPPKGRLHKHKDTPRTERTYHIPIKTNKKSIIYLDDAPYHCRVGQIYEINRELEHYSVNTGTTDRIHLIIEKNGPIND